MSKKLYRSKANHVIAGVCGGVAEYFDIDPTIVRLVLVIFTLVGGAGILLYIVAALIIPLAPEDEDPNVVDAEYKEKE